MGSLPLALSVHNLISSVGADAGFASVIGLAILALLYFAHARETANLREEAAMLAQRLQDAEARLDAARRVAPVQAEPQPAPAPAPATAQIPFAPAGLAAPALAAATRSVPVVAQAAPGPAPVPAVVAASSVRVTRVAGTAGPATAPAAPAAPAPSPATAPNGPAPGEPAPPLTAPAPGAPAAPGPPAKPPLQPPARPPAPAPAAVTAFRTAPATVAGAAGSGAAKDVANGASSPPVGVMDEPAAPVTEPPPRARQASIVPPDRNMFVSSRTRPGSPIGRRFAVLVGLLIAVGAVVAVVIATSGTGSQSGSNSAGASQTPASPKPAFDPAAVTVAVLNGTNTNQLAHHVADRLGARGYKEGRIATAANQTLTSTIIGYLPGAANRTAALHVAKALHLPSNTVTPTDQAAQAVACPPPSSCTANVIVTVGANLVAAY
jgi:hypothetical protein